MQRFGKTAQGISRLVVVLIISTIAHHSLVAQEGGGSAGAFLKSGVGTRVLSLGKAFVGVARGPAATYWNPAGLSQSQYAQFEFMFVNLPFDRAYNFASGVFPLKGIATFGVSWIGSRISRLEGRSGNTAEPDFTFGNSENAFYLSLARSVNSTLSVGGNIKFIRSSLHNLSGTGFGLDGAVFFRPNSRVSFGFTLQDLGTKIRWDKDFTESVPLTMRLGTAWRLFDHFLLVADVEKTSRFATKFHMGWEWHLTDTFPVRMGVDDSQFTGGLGIELPLGDHAFTVNYGFSNDKLANTTVHKFSLVVSLGKYPARSIIDLNAQTEPLEIDQAVAEPVDSGANSATEGTRFVLVTARVLNVRSGPGQNYQTLTQISKGQKFQAFETAGKWQKINLPDGETGWVSTSFVQLVETMPAN
ncbi:MAG: PorV/PorQ family protein [bacterium]